MGPQGDKGNQGDKGKPGVQGDPGLQGGVGDKVSTNVINITINNDVTIVV